MKAEKKKIDYILMILAPILILLLWMIACDKEWISHVVMPSPKKVVEAFASLWQKGTFQKHFIASIQRVLKGYFFGAVVGFIMGIFMGLFRKLDDIFSIIFSVLRSIPTIGLIPLFILWFGIGEETKILVIALAVFWNVLLNTENGISSTDRKLVEVAGLFQKGKLETIRKIILPSALPSIFTGLRLALSAAWRSVVAAEMIASVKGIGYLISYAREMSAPHIMFVGLLTLGFLGLILDRLLLKLEKKVIKWR